MYMRLFVYLKITYKAFIFFLNIKTISESSRNINVKGSEIVMVTTFFWNLYFSSPLLLKVHKEVIKKTDYNNTKYGGDFF